MNALVLLAGGSGTRMGNAVADKNLAPLAGRAVIAHSAQAFKECGFIEHTCIVFRDAEQRDAINDALAHLELELQFIQGGSTRQDSVFNALQQLPAQCSHVFIHDAARPLVSTHALSLLNEVVQRDGNAILARPLNDTVKRIPAENHLQKIPLEDLDRQRLWAMETPQAFTMPDILNAYKSAQADALEFTDDAGVANHYGLPLSLVNNPQKNPKITTLEDLAWVEFCFKSAN